MTGFFGLAPFAQWAPGMRHVLLCAAVLVTQACTPHVFSPPARTAPMEAPTPVGEGRTSLQVEGGSTSELFGDPIVQGTARLRYGLRDDLELVTEANLLYFTVGGNSSTAAHQGVYSLRLGVRRNFTRHFALTGGLGGGGSAGGGFLSPDVGIIAGYDNPYAIPFVTTRVFFSQPLTQNEVTIQHDEEVITRAPEVSYGFGLTTGLRVPFGDRADPTGSVLAGASFTLLADGEEVRGFSGFSAGLELRL